MGLRILLSVFFYVFQSLLQGARGEKNTKEREISLKNKKLMRGILKYKAPNVAGNVSSSVLL